MKNIFLKSIALSIMFFLMQGFPLALSQPNYHWFATAYAGNETYFNDVVVDADVDEGGTGLIYVAGSSNGNPVIASYYSDGTMNWAWKYNVIGEAKAITKRVGVYAAPDNYLFVGGIMYTPTPMSFLLVVDALTGNFTDAWSLSQPGSEMDVVYDLAIGPDGKVYGVGSVFTNFDPAYPFNTLLFRYDPESMNVTYSRYIASTTAGHALDFYNDTLYVLESRDNDIYLRELDYLSGVDRSAYRITHTRGSTLTPKDLEVINGKAFIVGGISTTSLFLSVDLNGTPVSLYSHTLTRWTNIEEGDQNRLFVYGDTNTFELYQNDSSRNLYLTYFMSNVSGSQWVNVTIFGGGEDDYSGGFDINEYGYVTGFTDSFPSLGINRSGFASIVSTNMDTYIWTFGCTDQENVSVVDAYINYGNLVNYIEVFDAPLGGDLVSPMKITILPIDFEGETCVAININNPVVINEFQALTILLLPLAILITLKKVLGKKL